MLFVSCFHRNKKQETKTIYDEFSLSTFIKASLTQNKNISLHFLDSLFRNAENDSIVFRNTVSYLARAYAEPNSLFNNEFLYGIILKAEMDSKWSTIPGKQEAMRKFKLLRQNNVGTVANDFRYWGPNGQMQNMHKINASKLLLFFYNPECNACIIMKHALEKSTALNNLSSKKKLKILCIYTDTALFTWYKHMQEFPSTWIQGRDEEEYLYKNDVYDLRAIPTMYLLDQNKKVIIKDCTSIDELEEKLQ